jgi:hypothetical protein
MIFRKEFPRPDNQLNVLKRYLHVLALIQNKDDTDNWNSRTLADMLYDDEPSTMISERMVSSYIDTFLKKDLGIDVKSIKGGRRLGLNQDIDKDLLPSLISVYSHFISSDVTRDNIIKRHIKSHGKQALWILARIYFASIQRHPISFDYESRSEKKIKSYTVNPYHLVYNGNNLYLACKNIEIGKDVLFIISKIKASSLKVSTSVYDEEAIPSIDKLFSKSLGAYIGQKQKVVLRYTKNIETYINDIIDSVDPKITDISSSSKFNFEASFEVTDNLFLCKQIFTCGTEAEIVSPPSLRKMMGKMLRESLGVYGG